MTHLTTYEWGDTSVCTEASSNSPVSLTRAQANALSGQRARPPGDRQQPTRGPLIHRAVLPTLLAFALKFANAFKNPLGNGKRLGDRDAGLDREQWIRLGSVVKDTEFVVTSDAAGIRRRGMDWHSPNRRSDRWQFHCCPCGT